MHTLSIEEKKTLLKIRRGYTKPIIGITGYLGKTTLIEMLSAVLETKGKVLKTAQNDGSWENNLNTVKKLNNSYDYAIFEFDYESGKRFAGLLRLIKPGLAVITNIGDAHLSYLQDAMASALERSEVVKYLARDGVAILNQDDDLSSSLSQFIITPRVFKYGLNQSAHFYASDIEQLGPDGLRFLLNGKKEITLPIYSVPNVYSFLACAATCQNLGIEIDETVEAVQNNFKLPKGRGNLVQVNKTFLLDESYPGTSRSLSKAARTLVGFAPYVEKTVLIIGNMNEKGKNLNDRHLNMGHFLSALPLDYIITLGDHARFIAQGASLIRSHTKRVIDVKNVNELLALIEEIYCPEMAITVKGLGNVVFSKVKQLIEKL